MGASINTEPTFRNYLDTCNSEALEYGQSSESETFLKVRGVLGVNKSMHFTVWEADRQELTCEMNTASLMRSELTKDQTLYRYCLYFLLLLNKKHKHVCNGKKRYIFALLLVAVVPIYLSFKRYGKANKTYLFQSGCFVARRLWKMHWLHCGVDPTSLLVPAFWHHF